ncbi:hypothetical protein K469DRAFT_226134 [Zopfia rhizophila CBS 207.26]|uniref:Uncharacterized protein n=1 Tax=Zopfia rhizophila CBS 207.26 TaxID=1314779 RepID=A0A6A6DUZ3_9PEZI|nr:hypothetical protein K469DRAFT_226134 [Zopfia rhizophila CBS 207.26]
MKNGLLDVQGYRLDSINQVSILRNESEDQSVSWASIVKLTLSLGQPYPNALEDGRTPTRVEVLSRTLTTNIYNKQYLALSLSGCLFIDYILSLQIRHKLMPWSSADEFQPHHTPLQNQSTLNGIHYSHLSLSGRPIVSLCIRNDSPIRLAQLQHEFDQSGGKKRRLFKIENSYLSTRRRSLNEDDEAWILHGVSVPFVLRRLLNENYKFIGEAYAYDVMHGEVLGMDLPRRQIVLECGQGERQAGRKQFTHRRFECGYDLKPCHTQSQCSQGACFSTPKSSFSRSAIGTRA